LIHIRRVEQLRGPHQVRPTGRSRAPAGPGARYSPTHGGNRESFSRMLVTRGVSGRCGCDAHREDAVRASGTSAHDAGFIPGAKQNAVAGVVPPRKNADDAPFSAQRHFRPPRRIRCRERRAPSARPRGRNAFNLTGSGRGAVVESLANFAARGPASLYVLVGVLSGIQKTLAEGWRTINYTVVSRGVIRGAGNISLRHRPALA